MITNLRREGQGIPNLLSPTQVTSSDHFQKKMAQPFSQDHLNGFAYTFNLRLINSLSEERYNHITCTHTMVFQLMMEVTHMGNYNVSQIVSNVLYAFLQLF